MNLARHRKSFSDLHQQVRDGEFDQAQVIRAFYDEHLAVNDLPAPFYLTTVGKVFRTYDRPRSELAWRGRSVNLKAVRKTALMTVEGERDGISAVGQTMAAQNLCRCKSPHHKAHQVQTGVGHHGVLSGKKWNHQIYPRVREMIYSSQG